jgi:hypothetical protein
MFNQVKMKLIFTVFFLLSIMGSSFCQGKYKIITGVGLGHLPADSKNLPFLVTTQEGEKILAKLHNEIEHMNATDKNKSILEASRGIKYAYLDKKNNFIVPFGVYDYADVFRLGRKAIVANKGKNAIVINTEKEDKSSYSGYDILFDDETQVNRVIQWYDNLWTSINNKGNND